MSLPFYSSPDSVDTVAHLIQTALTPIFMLSGIGTLINIFNTRLSRVSDKLEDVNKRLAASLSQTENDDNEDPYYTPQRLKLRQKRLQRRLIALDLAIIFNVLGGAFTCLAALALFVGSIRDSRTTTWLLALFGMALACTVCALGAFMLDTLLSWHGLRRDGRNSLLMATQAALRAENSLFKSHSSPKKERKDKELLPEDMVTETGETETRNEGKS